MPYCILVGWRGECEVDSPVVTALVAFIAYKEEIGSLGIDTTSVRHIKTTKPRRNACGIQILTGQRVTHSCRNS